jgi:BirA family biotin operon repressor/biotin-[acetyl-CoA-carboxylase] ligase
LAEAVAGYGVAARLKWPNDVLVGERKLGGILVEATSSGSGVEFVIVGVGMNLVLDPLELPGELRSSVTSIRAETGRSLEPLVAARAVLTRLRVWSDRLSREGRAPVLAAWRSAALPWWGERVEVQSAGTRVEGVARDIDESGALLLERADGATLRVLSGDARALRRLSG